MSSLEERKRKMREAGIPMPISQPLAEGTTSAIPITAQNADKHARLQALKSGVNRNQVQSLVKATSAQQSFEGIPETKQRKPQQNRPQQQGGGNKVAVQNFVGGAKVSSDFSAMDALYAGGLDSSSYSAPTYSQAAPQLNNTTQPELTVQQDGYGPVFSPENILAKKRQLAAANQQAQQIPQVANTNQQNFNFEYMQHMMEQIAKKTISEVLNSYTEKNKDKLTYENVNVKTNDGTQVIKTQDGKYYKLVPVNIKKN